MQQFLIPMKILKYYNPTNYHFYDSLLRINASDCPNYPMHVQQLKLYVAVLVKLYDNINILQPNHRLC